jgi:ATP-dependent Clp protease ATP-binding subunit ClpC
MFEKFTDRARRVIVLAQQEARALDHDWVGTEHILLGLLREDDGLAARALTAMGIGLDAMREAVQDIIPRGAEPLPESVPIPFTPRAKKVLELSLREALQLGSDYLGTEHILLALIREGDGVAAQVLLGSGVELDQARAQVITLLHGRHEEAGVSVAAAPADDELLGRLASIAARLSAIELRLGQSSSG